MCGELAFASQEKKVPGYVVAGQENVVGSRPDTSSRRLSNRSLNGSLSNATPLNRRLSLCPQQLGTNSINSANQGISYIKEGRKMQGQRMFPRPDLTSHLRDEAASVVSSFSGPLSP
jgi:protein regulator of cytokinesis 1